METVFLENLVGLHMLSGVDRVTHGPHNGGDVFNFTLNGVTYSAVENPSDGYRSMLDTIYVINAVLENTFDPIPVMAVIRQGSDVEILDIIDSQTGKTVISIGTNYYDDYYPCFVADFDPRNMAPNYTKG